MFFPYITGKNFTFRILVEVAFVAWLLLAMLDAKYRPRFSWILSAFVLFLVVIGVADLFGANPFKSFWSNFERMEGYITILHLFMYFLVASAVLNTQKLWNAFWYASLGASVVIAYIGLKPIIGAFPFITGLPRIDATFGNPIYLAVYCLFHFFIALILMVRWRGTHWHQILLGFVALLHLVTMVLTLTRGTVLGFIGGAIITTVLIALFERERAILRKVAISALAVVALVLVTGFAVKDTHWAKTAPIVSRFTQMSLSEGTINARFMNWGMAWEGVKERPLLGWGQGNYEYVFSKYYDPNMYAQEPWFDRTHDIIFDWLIAGGFLGLIAYLLIHVSLLLHLWILDPEERRWSWKSFASVGAIKALLKKSSNTFTATERALWTGLLAAYMFHNLFVFDNIISYILFASMLAYLHWRVTEGHDPLFAHSEFSRETIVAVVLPVMLAGGGLTVWYLNVPGITTSEILIQALIPQRALPDGTQVAQTPEQILNDYKKAAAIDQLGRQEVREQLAQSATRVLRTQGVSADTKAAFESLALSEMKRELARNPDSARLRLFMGTLYNATGRYTDSEQTFEQAVALTPTKQIALFQLAEVKLVLGKIDEAVDIFKRAYELQPAYDEAAKLYALSLIRSGKDKEAVDLLTAQFGTPAVDDSRLFIEWVHANRYDIAATILEGRVAKNPDDVQQVVSLAAAYGKLGRKDDALKLLADTEEKHPEYKGQLDKFIKEIRGY